MISSWQADRILILLQLAIIQGCESICEIISSISRLSIAALSTYLHRNVLITPSTVVWIAILRLSFCILQPSDIQHIEYNGWDREMNPSKLCVFQLMFDWPDLVWSAPFHQTKVVKRPLNLIQYWVSTSS